MPLYYKPIMQRWILGCWALYTYKKKHNAHKYIYFEINGLIGTLTNDNIPAEKFHV